jgi:demethylmenaquinone methyltransferase/2-methoxy-6-polyprenyl-1,4-benzoquinol methylase
VSATDSADAMAAYYARRAPSYERIYQRPSRQPNLRALEAWLAQVFEGRRVLEIACGTGWWTPHGAARAADWLAPDLNPETLALARAKAMPPCVRFRTLDVHALEDLAETGFDGAFAGCWWSHLPLARLPASLAALHARLAPGARVVWLDNRWVEGESTPIVRRDAEGNGYQLRPLDDGSTHEVLKNYPRADEAIALLGPRAFDALWAEGSHYWTLSYRLA